MANLGPLDLVKSMQRVADHGEVFTPAGIVDAMLNLVADESHRIDSRFLEPACGSGNFLVPVVKRKLTTVHNRYGKSDFERKHHALLALMCIYGIELLDDNVEECRAKLVNVFTEFLGPAAEPEWHHAALNVLAVNIVHGDALSMTTREIDPQPIAFPEWSYLGRGVYRRRDFRYDTLTRMSSFSAEDTLFADLGKHELFVPTVDYGSLSVHDIAAARVQRG